MLQLLLGPQHRRIRLAVDQRPFGRQLGQLAAQGVAALPESREGLLRPGQA